jgi:hypothetical protein
MLKLERYRDKIKKEDYEHFTTSQELVDFA